MPFSDEDQDHVQVLREYWELCFPGDPFQRKSKRWQDAGFQVSPNDCARVKNARMCFACATSFMHECWVVGLSVGHTHTPLSIQSDDPGRDFRGVCVRKVVTLHIFTH